MDGKRILYFRNIRTGERSREIDVSSRTEREIERVMRGMLINIGDDWIVCDSADDDAPSA